MSRFRDWAKIFQNPCFSGYHVILYPSLKNRHKNVKLSHSNNNINTFLFQRQPIHGHYHWQDEHMPAWLHHPVEKSHHLTWKYHQSSKYNERVFLIFHDPTHPLSSSSHMHFLKQYCQYEDPLKLVRSPCSRAQISVFVLGRCLTTIPF